MVNGRRINWNQRKKTIILYNIGKHINFKEKNEKGNKKELFLYNTLHEKTFKHKITMFSIGKKEKKEAKWKFRQTLHKISMLMW